MDGSDAARPAWVRVVAISARGRPHSAGINVPAAVRDLSTTTGNVSRTTSRPVLLLPRSCRMLARATGTIININSMSQGRPRHRRRSIRLAKFGCADDQQINAESAARRARCAICPRESQPLLDKRPRRHQPTSGADVRPNIAIARGSWQQSCRASARRVSLSSARLRSASSGSHPIDVRGTAHVRTLCSCAQICSHCGAPLLGTRLHRLTRT